MLTHFLASHLVPEWQATVKMTQVWSESEERQRPEIQSWSPWPRSALQVQNNLKLTVITARKRSYCEGNVFTGVCQSTGGCTWSTEGGRLGIPGPGWVPGLGVCSGTRGIPGLLGWPWSRGVGKLPAELGGVQPPGGVGVPWHTRRQVPYTWRYMGYGRQAGGTHPTGMLSCSI